MKNTEYKKIVEEIEQIRKRYLLTLSSHKIFQGFNKLIAPNIIGKRKAEKNAKVLAMYGYFFQTTKEATRCYFLIELAKFFDKPNTRNKTRTVYWALNYAKQNIHRLNKKEFLKYLGEEQDLSGRFNNYKQLEVNDLKKLQIRLKNNKDKIKKLIKYRDQYLAHDDMKKIKVKLTIREMDILLRIVKDVINLFCIKLTSTSNSYINFELEPTRSLNKIIDDLKKYKSKLLNYKN